MNALTRFFQAIRRRETPFYDRLYRTARRIRGVSMPVIPGLHRFQVAPQQHVEGARFHALLEQPLVLPQLAHPPHAGRFRHRRLVQAIEERQPLERGRGDAHG